MIHRSSCPIAADPRNECCDCHALNQIHRRTEMVKTTRQQREALKRVYLRVVQASLPEPVPGKATVFYVPTYREFRRKVQPTIGCDGAVMVPFAGMWLGIERDGYTHS